MNNLLIEEYPLIVLPSLAKKIGLNEAVVLQQVHFWIGKKKNFQDGYFWVYNTYDEWVKQFPFWSKSTIRRTITSLEKQGLLIAGNYNKAGFDNTKWHTIDYNKLESVSRPSAQNEQTECSNWTGASAQNEQTNTIDYPETNYRDKRKEESADPIIQLLIDNNIVSPAGLGQTLLDDLNDITNKFGFEDPEYMITEAIKDAARGNGRTWKFVYTKLMYWRKSGIKNSDDLARFKEQEIMSTKKNKPRKNKSKDEIDWDNI